jgi:hypothetical protein
VAKGHDKITPDGKALMEQIAELAKLQVRIGYQAGEEVDESGVDMLDIAMWNELGTSRSPSRPFLRRSVDNNREVIEKFCKAQLKTLVKGATAKQVLNAIGSAQKGIIQETISKSKDWAAENAPGTIKRKGSDQPLVDMGRLVQSANYVIAPKGGD